MAIGATVEIHPDVKTIELLASATATSSAPTLVTDGLGINDIVGAFGAVPSVMDLTIYSTAGSATMTASLRLWGWKGSTIGWVPIGTGTDAGKGVINGGATIGETSADLIKHSEPLYDLGAYSRLYLQVVSIGGTATAVTGVLSARRGYGGGV